MTIRLLIVLAYYLMQMSGDALVEKGWIPVWTGTWTPNILFLALGGTLFYLAWRDISPARKLHDRLQKMLERRGTRTK